MSPMTSTVPLALNILIVPFAASLTTTSFGVGDWPGTTLAADVPGFSTSPGYNDTNVGDVALTAVRLIATPSASEGITQFPATSPVTCTVSSSPAPIGVARGPMLSGAGRVSSRRQGVIGTNVVS